MSGIASLIAYGSDSEDEDDVPVDQSITQSDNSNEKSTSNATVQGTNSLHHSTDRPTTQSSNPSLTIDGSTVPSHKRTNDQISSDVSNDREITTNTVKPVNLNQQINSQTAIQSTELLNEQPDTESKRPRIDLMDSAPKTSSHVILTSNKPKIKYSFASSNQPANQVAAQSTILPSSHSNSRKMGIDPRLLAQFESISQSEIIEVKQSTIPRSIPSPSLVNQSDKPALNQALKLWNPETGREEVVSSVSSKHRSKHQVNSLIDQAARVRSDIDAAQASGAASRANTRAKYGW